MKTALALLLSATAMACAQQYSINWFTIDGGGGTSTGGVYSVSGTIGQPDAGTLSGGSYSLQGGFWPGIIQSPGAPLLSVTNLGSTVVVFWPAPATGFVLDQTLTLNGSPPPWMQVPFPYQTNGGNISVTVSPATGAKYYRLRGQ